MYIRRNECYKMIDNYKLKVEVSMIENIKAIIEHIEEHYHEDLSKEDINEITGLSYGFVRNEFKQIVNIPLDKYRKRRQLTLIINEIAQSSLSINKNNLSPWSSENSFRVAFKNEFHVTAKKVIDGKFQGNLQPKFDMTQYSTDYRTVCQLIKTYGNPSDAVLFLLSLPPYINNGISQFVNFSTPKAKCESIIEYTLGNISEEDYKEKLNLLIKYYDLDRWLIFSKEKLFSDLFIKVNSGLINQLINKGPVYLSYKPKDIRTIWSITPDIKNVREKNSRQEFKDLVIAMPNELIDIMESLSYMQQTIFRELIIQDCGVHSYETFEELMNLIKVNYNKPISHTCDHCNCDDIYLEEGCPRYEEMDEKEKKVYFSKPDYEPLDYNTLRRELDILLVNGLLYLETDMN